MTHNIIHDEEKMEEIVDKYCLNVFRPIPHALSLSAKGAMKQYAEHTLVKFIDGEVERLQANIIRNSLDPYRDELIDGIIHEQDEQARSLQSLKAQLTKSK